MPLVLRVSNHPSANLNLYSPMQKIIRRYLRWLARRIYPWADAVIAVSDGVADELARITHMPRERIRTIYNPIVTPEFLARSEETLDHPWLAPGAPPVILGVGGFKIQKDFRTLLRAFKRVRAVQPVRLVILGKGPQRQSLKSVAKQQGFADDVYMPGHRANPMARMSKASVFALSSLWEGLPGVLIDQWPAAVRWSAPTVRAARGNPRRRRLWRPGRPRRSRRAGAGHPEDTVVPAGTPVPETPRRRVLPR